MRPPPPPPLRLASTQAAALPPALVPAVAAAAAQQPCRVLSRGAERLDGPAAPLQAERWAPRLPLSWPSPPARAASARQRLAFAQQAQQPEQPLQVAAAATAAAAAAPPPPAGGARAATAAAAAAAAEAAVRGWNREQRQRSEAPPWLEACRVCGRGLPSQPPSHSPAWRPWVQRPAPPARRLLPRAARAGSQTAPTAARRQPPSCLQAANAAVGPRRRSQPRAQWPGCARARKRGCEARWPPTRKPPAQRFGAPRPQHGSAAVAQAALAQGTSGSCACARAHLRSKRRCSGGGLRLRVCESLQRGGALRLGLCALCRLAGERGAKRLRACEASARNARRSASSDAPRAPSAAQRWPRARRWPPAAACFAQLHCAPAAAAAAQPGEELGARVSTPAALCERAESAGSCAMRRRSWQARQVAHLARRLSLRRRNRLRCRHAHRRTQSWRKPRREALARSRMTRARRRAQEGRVGMRAIFA